MLEFLLHFIFSHTRGKVKDSVFNLKKKKKLGCLSVGTDASNFISLGVFKVRGRN